MTPSTMSSHRAAAGVALLLTTSSALDAPLLASRFGLSISECDGLLTSEISEDYGSLADLWDDATEWRWTVASSDQDEDAVHPFIVCEKTPDMSGYGRKTILKARLGISIKEGDIDTVFSDRQQMGCFIISANAKVLGETLEGLPADDGSENTLRVQPMGPGLKMLKGSVDSVQGWINRANAGTPAEPPVQVESEENTPTLTAYSYGDTSMLRLDLNLCPAADRVPLGDTTLDMISFLTGNDGDTVKQSSFFYDLTGQNSGRINFWSAHMKSVLTTFDGGEQCLSALQQHMVIDGSDLEYGSLRTFLPTQEMGDGWEDCVWYAMRGLALHPSVCRLDYVEDVAVFPEPGDGVMGTTGEDVSTDPSAPAVVDTSQPSISNGASPSGDEQLQESESEDQPDPSDLDGGVDKELVTDTDSGARAGLPGVSSVAATLVACWMTLL